MTGESKLPSRILFQMLKAMIMNLSFSSTVLMSRQQPMEVECCPASRCLHLRLTRCRYCCLPAGIRLQKKRRSSTLEKCPVGCIHCLRLLYCKTMDVKPFSSEHLGSAGCLVSTTLFISCTCMFLFMFMFLQSFLH